MGWPRGCLHRCIICVDGIWQNLVPNCVEGIDIRGDYLLDSPVHAFGKSVCLWAECCWVVKSCWMPSDFDRTVMTSLRNWGPWSERILVGHPWGKITRWRSVVAIVEAAMSGRGSASRHLVRYSVITSMYLFPFVDGGKGPMRSQPINSNGWETVMGCSCPTFYDTVFICWHVGQVRV